ncbi:DoxX family protein [Candidatus Woesearchaeota archaeon]|nr:MAG: DoxX family protein [Candidatus Woesearchaeota archaeon]
MFGMFEKTEKYFWFVLRVIAGFLFFMHGAGKLGWYGNGSVAGFAGAFGFPIWLAYIATFIELIGGLLILLGLFTRIAALLGGLQMIVALIIAHFPKGWNPLANGGELALLYLVLWLVFLAKGAGIWGLEKALFKKEC